MARTYSPRKFATRRPAPSATMSAAARSKTRYDGCARCTLEIRPNTKSRPIPYDDYGQRTLPPDAVKYRDEQLLGLDAEGKAAIGERLHACLPHNCLTIVESEIAALEASTLSSAVVGSRCRLDLSVPLGPARCPCPAGTEHTPHGQPACLFLRDRTRHEVGDVHAKTQGQAGAWVAGRAARRFAAPS